MNGKQLKNSILQWAIQGKLVPQDPNDEPASVLLERIRAEKARLVKEGKIKKDKNESIIFKGDDNSYYEKFVDGKVVCIDDEIPFEIPAGWEWTRLNSIAIDSADGPFGSNLKKEHYTNKREVRIIQLSNIGDNGWKDANTKYTTFKHLELIKRSEAFPNDLIIAKMMPAGRAILCPNHEQKYVLSSDAVRFNIPDIISHRYLYHAINSPVFIDQVYGEVQGITRVRTSLQKLRNYLLPIPPKSEQDRILSALDSIEQLILQYESCRLSLDSLNKTIQDKLKKSILQEAIQGKLVPQDPNDEPAEKLLEKINAEKQRLVKEGKLKAKDAVSSVIFKGEDNKYYEQVGGKVLDISEEIPFGIPDSWVWVRHNSLFDISGGSQPPKALFSEIQQEGYIRLYQIRDYGPTPQPIYIPNKYATKTTNKGDVLLARYGASLGKVFIAEEGAYNVAMAKVIPLFESSDIVLKEYLLLYYKSNLYQRLIKDRSRCAQAGFNKDDLQSLLFPLPPIKEQARICAKYNAVIANTMSR